MFKRQQRHHRSRLPPIRHRRCRRSYGSGLRSLFCIYVALHHDSVTVAVGGWRLRRCLYCSD